jgi:DNA-3-methyladenine glycosylase II
MPSKREFTLDAQAPFDFDLTAQIFQHGDSQIRSFQNGVFQQVLRLDGKLALVRVNSAGTVEKPKLEVTLESNVPLTALQVEKAKAAVGYIFNLDFLLAGFYEDVKDDAVMAGIARQLFGLKNPTSPTVFESLVDSIVEQQISIKVAHTIEERITKSFGDKLQLQNSLFYAYPTPQSIAAAAVSEVQSCGLSLRKAEYIHNAAKLIAEDKLDLERLKSNPDPEQIITELDSIRGIGVWTAELTMLRGMQRLDALPADDFGIRRVISRYYCGGKPIKTAEAREIAKRWGKWKGLAAFYLIIAEVKGIHV